MRTCTIEGCDRKHNAKGLCGMLYYRQRAVTPIKPTTYDPSDCSVVSICGECGTRAIHLTMREARHEAAQHRADQHKPLYASVSA